METIIEILLKVIEFCAVFTVAALPLMITFVAYEQIDKRTNWFTKLSEYFFKED